MPSVGRDGELAGSKVRADTSLMMAAPAATASRITAALRVSMETRMPSLGERPDDRDDALSFSASGHGVRARPGRFAADVENIRALSGEPAAMRDRVLRALQGGRRRKMNRA